MKFLEEYRDPAAAKDYVRLIKATANSQWTIMEICGGQTHTIVKYGLDEIIPDKITLVHGPGCPVCVTAVELIDKAIELAGRKDVIFCSFGDMLRVPGSDKDLLWVKANGGDIRIVYSPMDALKIARDNPQKEVVFFAVGFETTAPANAMAVYQAKKQLLNNFSVLVSHVLVPPAMELILGSPQNKVQGFLAAGHVCAVMGYADYEPIAAKYKIPIVVTGFEPLDLLQGIYLTIKQLEENRHDVENQYSRAVSSHGNIPAKQLMAKVFKVITRKWRGLGDIKDSGLALSDEYLVYDAEKKFGLENITVEESSECKSGLVLQGLLKPHDCPAFGTKCSPEHPLGATMVSTEGACAAYYRYRSHQAANTK
jgi:hydrogenase expression/formation protein HypD